MSEALTFVNGEAECKCKLRFSSGHGQYSDVHYINLCDMHTGASFLSRLAAELDLATDPAKENAQTIIHSAIAMIEQHAAKEQTP